MAKAANLGALLAKIPAAAAAKQAFDRQLAEGKGLAAKGRELVAKGQDFLNNGKAYTEKGKALAAKGLLAHYMISGLALGSMLLLLWGGHQALARVLDPTAAAGVLGIGVAGILVGGALFATRSRDD